MKFAAIIEYAQDKAKIAEIRPTHRQYLATLKDNSVSKASPTRSIGRLSVAERGPNRLLSGRGRRESPVGLLRFDRHAQVFAIPGGERLGIARFEEYTANSNYLFHTNPFSSRLRNL